MTESRLQLLELLQEYIHHVAVAWLHYQALVGCIRCQDREKVVAESGGRGQWRRYRIFACVTGQCNLPRVWLAHEGLQSCSEYEHILRVERG
jgi:hypothetical protein